MKSKRVPLKILGIPLKFNGIPLSLHKKQSNVLYSMLKERKWPLGFFGNQL
jgi:hypothetical protein